MHISNNFGKTKLKDLKISKIQEWSTKQCSIASSGYRRVFLFKSLIKYAYTKCYIKNNIFDRIVMPKRKNTKEKLNYYTKEELHLFLKLAKEQLSLQWYVFFYLLAHTGIRRGEALALHWEDLKDNKLIINKTLSINNGSYYVSDTVKTDKSNRIIYIHTELKELLERLKLSSNSIFIFSNTKNSFIASSQPIRQLKKIKGIRYISPHGFRHTHCSLLFSSGASISEVQKRLGHTDVKTTLDVYNHLFKEDEKKALKNYINFFEK